MKLDDGFNLGSVAGKHVLVVSSFREVFPPGDEHVQVSLFKVRVGISLKGLGSVARKHMPLW